jgi:polyhydroxybutyrate depolymerase
MEYNFKKSAKRSELSTFILFTLIFTCLFAATPGYTQDESGSFEFDGYNRKYEVYLPEDYEPNINMPLVVSIHGSYETIEWYKKYTLLHEVADTSGFIVVYPQGLNQTWNGEFIDPIAPSPVNTDDVGFISALIDTMHARFDIDLARVYCCGFSTGCEMTFRMAGECRQRFAAVAGIASTLFDEANKWQLIGPIPVLQMNGTADAFVPYYNGRDGLWPIREAIDYWLNTNHCTSQSDTLFVPDIVVGDNCTVQKISFTDCDSESELIHYKIINGGHSWPGSAFTFGSEGNKNMDINANVEILNFFKNYENPFVNLAFAQSRDVNNFNKTDTFLFTATLSNPENHSAEIFAIYQDTVFTFRDSVQLFDDGLHSDGSAFDNIYGGLKDLSDLDEAIYSHSFRVTDLDFGLTTFLKHPYYFTTIGPIITADQPVIDNGFGVSQKFQLILRSVGSVASAQNLKAKITTIDSRVKSVRPNERAISEIAAGEMDTTSYYAFKYADGYNPESTKNNPIHFDVDIYMNDIQYWSDSVEFYADITAPDVPTNLIALVNDDNSVNLSWLACQAEDLHSYNLYRSINNDTTIAEHLFSVDLDTAFTDSTITISATYYYWLTAVDFVGNESAFSEVDSVEIIIDGFKDFLESIPSEFALFQNYPNPFNPKTVIRYVLPVTCHLDLSIYNVLGQKVATLVNKKQPAGSYKVEWDASGFASGVYYYQLVAGDNALTRKMALIR